MLELLAEILIQILIEVVAECAYELGLGSVSDKLRDGKKANPYLAFTGIIVLGAIIGFIVTLIFSQRFIADPPIKGLSLILSPLFAGCTLFVFGKLRRQRGHKTSRLATFWGGALFALAFAIVRWIMIEGMI